MNWSKMGLSKNQGGMRFCDFVCFNKAFLAKHIWCLRKSPDILVARIMKVKYYPDCSVVEALLGIDHLSVGGVSKGLAILLKMDLYGEWVMVKKSEFGRIGGSQRLSHTWCTHLQIS
jgi:hypothetical protein